MSGGGVLPNGSVTQGDREYVDTWRSFSGPILDIIAPLGFRRYGFDPGVLFSRASGEILDMPTDVIAAINAKIAALQARLAAAEGLARGLTFDALRAVNVPRVAAFGQTLDAWSPMEWACAAAGEMGELCNALKKRSRKEDPKRPGHDITGKPIPTLRDVGDEIADVVIYLDLLGAALGIDMGEAVARKWNEVSKKMGHDAHLAPASTKPDDKKDD